MWPSLLQALSKKDDTSFSLDSDEFSALRHAVARGRASRLKTRIAGFNRGLNGEIMSNGKPVLPVEIHHLTALLGIATWYTSDGEKRGAIPATLVLASIAKGAFAGGTAFGALHLSTVKLALEQCKSAGAGDSILGGLLAIVKPCWELVQNSSARAALALIPSNLVRLYPNLSDLQNFIEGKSRGLLLPAGLSGYRMLRSLAGLMNISLRLTDTSRRVDERLVDFIYSCNRAKSSRTVDTLPTKKPRINGNGTPADDLPADPSPLSLVAPLSNDALALDDAPSSDEDASLSDEDASSSDKDVFSSDDDASSSDQDESSSDDDIRPVGAGTPAPDPGLPTVAHELSLSTAVSAMVHGKRKNYTKGTTRNLACSYRWIISTFKIKSENEKNVVQLLRVPKVGHTHNTGDFANNRHLPPAISATNALLSALKRGKVISRPVLKAHLKKVEDLELPILRRELISYGAYESQRQSTLPGAILTASSMDHHNYVRSWARKAQDLRQNPDSSKATSLPIEATSLPIDRVAFVCYCSVNCLEIGSDTLSCRGSGCSYGGIFHSDCLQSKMPDLDIDDAKKNLLFRCLSCTEEGKIVPDTATVESTISFSAIANDLHQLQQQEDDKANSVSSNLLSKSSTRDRADALGIPSLFTGHRFSITNSEYYNFHSTIRRALRSGNTVGKDVLIVLKEYQDMLGYHVFLSYKLSDDGLTLKQLHCIIVSPQQLELMNANPAFFYLQFSDQTHCTTKTALQLGAITGLIPEAGGKGVCGAWTFWLPGGGVKSGESQVGITDRDVQDKTQFMEECSLFYHELYAKGFLKQQPRMRILMTDKDKAAFNGSLRARKAILERNQLLCENSLLTSLAVLAHGASVEEIDAAGVLITSLPMHVDAECTLPMHNALPIDMDQLFSDYPNTSHFNAAPLTAEAAAACDVLFRKTWLAQWGPGVMRGIAHHARNALIRCTALLLNAPNHGLWNIAALQLLWLECPAAPDGLLSNYILDACLVFALLCLWHGKKALEKAFNNHVTRDQVLRRIALDGIYAVFAGTMSVASYKAMWYSNIPYYPCTLSPRITQFTTLSLLGHHPVSARSPPCLC